MEQKNNLSLNDFHNIFAYDYKSEQILDLYKVYQQSGFKMFFDNISKADQDLMVVYMEAHAWKIKS